MEHSLLKASQCGTYGTDWRKRESSSEYAKLFVSWDFVRKLKWFRQMHVKWSYKDWLPSSEKHANCRNLAGPSKWHRIRKEFRNTAKDKLPHLHSKCYLLLGELSTNLGWWKLSKNNIEWRECYLFAQMEYKLSRPLDWKSFWLAKKSWLFWGIDSFEIKSTCILLQCKLNQT